MNKLREYVFYGFICLFFLSLSMVLSITEANWTLMFWHEQALIMWAMFSALLLTFSSYLLWKNYEEISYLKALLANLRRELEKPRRS